MHAQDLSSRLDRGTHVHVHDYDFKQKKPTKLDEEVPKILSKAKQETIHRVALLGGQGDRSTYVDLVCLK